jgi:ribosomal protein L34
MAKKGKSKGAQRFKEYVDELMSERGFDAVEDDALDDEEEALPVVNESYVQAFADEWQAESDERLTYVRAFSLGEIREAMHVYRTFDSKAPDPLPNYLAALSSHGFQLRMGCSGEMVILASRRNRSDQLLTTAR